MYRFLSQFLKKGMSWKLSLTSGVFLLKRVVLCILRRIVRVTVLKKRSVVTVLEKRSVCLAVQRIENKSVSNFGLVDWQELWIVQKLIRSECNDRAGLVREERTTNTYLQGRFYRFCCAGHHTARQTTSKISWRFWLFFRVCINFKFALLLFQKMRGLTNCTFKERVVC